MPVANTLAYWRRSSVTKKKVFNDQTRLKQEEGRITAVSDGVRVGSVVRCDDNDEKIKNVAKNVANYINLVSTLQNVSSSHWRGAMIS